MSAACTVCCLPSSRDVASLERVRRNTMLDPVHKRLKVLRNSQTWSFNTAVPNAGYLEMAKEAMHLGVFLGHILQVRDIAFREDGLARCALPGDQFVTAGVEEGEVSVSCVHDAGILIS